MMKAAIRATWLAGLLAFASQAAWAQGISPFGAVGLPLTAKDFAAMAKAVEPLLNDDSLALGTSRQWSNAASGNQGTVTLLERFTYDYQGSRLPCRKLKYHVQI